MPSFCRLELPLWPYKDTVSILFKPSCVMPYTGDFYRAIMSIFHKLGHNFIL